MLKKRYISKGQICKVTFILPEEIQAHSVSVVGDFNNWHKEGHAMTRLKSGTWKVSILLEAGREYQFRYFVNGAEWHNDDEPDKFVIHPYGGENSVVVT